MCFPDMGNSYESGVCVCLQRPGKVRNPPEVRSSGGSGGGSGDGKPGTFPRVPNFPVMRRTPGESLQTSSGRGEDAGSPSGWTGGCAGARPLRGAGPAAATSLAGLPAAAGGRAPEEGTGLLEGTCLWLRARRAGEWRGSACVRSSSRPCLPPSGARWYLYLFPAAAPSDSCR